MVTAGKVMLEDGICLSPCFPLVWLWWLCPEVFLDFGELFGLTARVSSERPSGLRLVACNFYFFSPACIHQWSLVEARGAPSRWRDPLLLEGVPVAVCGDVMVLVLFHRDFVAVLSSQSWSFPAVWRSPSSTFSPGAFSAFR